MKLAIVAACLVASLSLASHALADGSQTIATLQQPIAAPTQFVAGGGVWKCEGGTCVAGYTPDQTFGPSQCREVAKRVGPVTGFKDDYKRLQPALLDRCNANLTSKASVTASR